MKNSTATVVIYVIGLPGTGKYTISKELKRMDTGFDFKLVHNHHINNVIFDLINIENESSFSKEIWQAVGQVRDCVLSFLSTYKKTKSYFYK